MAKLRFVHFDVASGIMIIYVILGNFIKFSSDSVVKTL